MLKNSLSTIHGISEHPILQFHISKINFLSDLLGEPEDLKQWKAAVDLRERYGGSRDVGANGVAWFDEFNRTPRIILKENENANDLRGLVPCVMVSEARLRLAPST